jgi:hypothetical protein
MAALDLDGLEALAKAATGGEWFMESLEPRTYGSYWISSAEMKSIADCSEAVGLTEHGFCGWVSPEQRKANAAFIEAFNPTAALTLLALARRPVTTSYNPSYAEMRERCERLSAVVRADLATELNERRKCAADPFTDEWQDAADRAGQARVEYGAALAALLPSDTDGAS